MHVLCSLQVLFIFAPTNSKYAGVVELVDTLDLGSSAERCGSSSLPARTKFIRKTLIRNELRFFVFYNLV